jgi:predicted PurR-regulated permease PerM
LAAVTNARKISYLLFALMAVAVVALHLGPVLLSGLFTFMILDLTYRKLTPRVPAGMARFAALGVFIVSGTALFWMFGDFARKALGTLPTIANTAIPKLLETVEAHGFNLPFEGVYDLREIVVRAIRENVQVITRASGLLTMRFFHIVVGVFVAVLCFMTTGDETYQPNQFDAIRKEFNARITTFMLGFEKVFGAQIMISGINTVLTSIFLIAMGFPYLTFLIPATFILGCLPLVGNISSNTIIVGTALTFSFQHAVFSLVFLVVIHKLEYFLNSRIMGSSINAPMWQTLLGILLGDVVMGVAGILLAPALIHYVKEEMQSIPADIP